MNIGELGLRSAIQAIRPEPAATAIADIGSAPEGKKAGFADFLSESLKQVNESGLEADRLIGERLKGNEVNPHTTIIALQEADLSFRLLISVKQRLEQSFQELLRTQI